MRCKCEIIRDFDGKYYANVYIGEWISSLTEYISYHKLKSALSDRGITIPKFSDVIFQTMGKKSYAECCGTYYRQESLHSTESKNTISEKTLQAALNVLDTQRR